MQGAYINKYANTWAKTPRVFFTIRGSTGPQKHQDSTRSVVMRVFLVGYRMVGVGTSGLLVCWLVDWLMDWVLCFLLLMFFLFWIDYTMATQWLYISDDNYWSWLLLIDWLTEDMRRKHSHVQGCIFPVVHHDWQTCKAVGVHGLCTRWGNEGIISLAHAECSLNVIYKVANPPRWISKYPEIATKTMEKRQNLPDFQL